MIVKPEMTVKHLADAKPGELIRIKAFQTSAVALVADVGKTDKKALIMLTQYASENPPPRYIELGRDRVVVLSYGHGYELVADHSPDAIDIGAAKFWELNGALVLTETSSLLQVMPVRGWGYDAVHYDIGSGKIVKAPGTADVVLIGKWELRLASDIPSNQPGPVLVAFGP